MKVVFEEIIAGDVDAVRERVAKDARVVGAVAGAAPKKYAAQSPLQVAYRHGEFEIAALLLTHGADPNYIEHPDREPWAMPVLHHAIKAAVSRSRWLRPTWREEEPWQLRNTADRADAAHAALLVLLEAGADVHALDSYGNSSLGRAALDARDVLPRYRHNDPDWVDPKPLNPELVEDLTRVFRALKARGADPHRSERDLGASLLEFYGAEPVARFLDA
ncbi:ankyrin repeat domain-containing protein [Nocardioides alkalitolerans]|uniref:ankyrin repeat domain-containing protein n=1 Tax=Nocardioides alkalitolerans TaxID=281714 RepID=UPI0004130DD3|nr:ankyrin repeat domain-containing protein [Nocardioides alkalitolerans]